MMACTFLLMSSTVMTPILEVVLSRPLDEQHDIGLHQDSEGERPFQHLKERGVQHTAVERCVAPLEAPDPSLSTPDLVLLVEACLTLGTPWRLRAFQVLRCADPLPHQPHCWWMCWLLHSVQQWVPLDLGGQAAAMRWPANEIPFLLQPIASCLPPSGSSCAAPSWAGTAWR